jgi:hypothetical protein
MDNLSSDALGAVGDPAHPEKTNPNTITAIANNLVCISIPWLNALEPHLVDGFDIHEPCSSDGKRCAEV